MSRITINQDGVCLFSDREIIWRALMSKCRQLERILKRDNLSENERRSLQDEYERTFAITENYRSDNHGKRNWKTVTTESHFVDVLSCRTKIEETTRYR